MPNILITNDDGINSEGLIRLAEAASHYGQVYVVAPDGERSAMSHRVTLRHSFTAKKVDFPVEGVTAYACSGTPADCVRIGVRSLIEGGVDYVFSGINYGFNTATDLQYSATAGAAFEGSFQKIHSIAFSEDARPCHEVSDYYLLSVMQELMSKPYVENAIYNANFPGCPLSECKGLLRDRTVSDDVFYDDNYEKTKMADGSYEFMVKGTRKYQAKPGTDLEAVFNNYVSLGIVHNIG